MASTELPEQTGSVVIASTARMSELSEWMDFAKQNRLFCLLPCCGRASAECPELTKHRSSVEGMEFGANLQRICVGGICEATS